MLKLAILISGGGTNLQAIIDAIKTNKLNAEIACIISNKSSAYGLKRGIDNGIPCFVIKKKDYNSLNEYDMKMIEVIKENNVDLIVTAGFMVVLSKLFVKTFNNKIINVHPSLIPSFCGKGYYGLKVHEAALLKGVKITGATVHFIDEGTDTGKIILQKAVKVKENDTAESLQKRVMKQAEHVILPQAIQMFADGLI